MLSMMRMASSSVASWLMLVMFLVITSFACSLAASFFLFMTRCTRSRSVMMPVSELSSFFVTSTQLMFFSVISLTAFVSLSVVWMLIAPVVMMSLTYFAWLILVVLQFFAFKVSFFIAGSYVYVGARPCMCMRFGKANPQQQGVKDLRKGVEELQKGLEEEEERLKELFGVLKYELLASLSASLDESTIRSLKKQVRHVISVARTINYTSLEKSFLEEEEVIKHLEELVEQYPSTDLSSSADIQSAIRKLRGMVERQQELIFEHKEILLHEKQRVVEILSEASALEQAMEKNHSLSAEVHRTIS